MLWVERFEGAYALCEDENGRRVTLLRAALPKALCEGDLLLWEGAWRIDREAVARRRAVLREKAERLIKKR
jgi:hypothetical protein